MMNKLTHSVCLGIIVLTVAFAVLGQRRPGLPRPRPSLPAQPTQPADSNTPSTAEIIRKTGRRGDAETGSLTTASPRLRFSPSRFFNHTAQTYKPAIEYHSFMDMRFYENQGGFLVERLEVVFPPAGVRKGTFVISKATGEVVKTVPLRLQAPLDTFTMFGMFEPDGVPGNANVAEPGDYVLSIKIGDQTLTRLAFSLKREASSDPFNPKTTFMREGPWRDLGYFSNRTDDPASHLEFTWWTSMREIPAGNPRPLVTLHILRGAQEIATTRSPVVVSQTDWQCFHQEFHFPTEKQVRWMTLADLTKQDGDYTIIAKVNGKQFKSYKAQVRGGQLQRLPQNQLGFEPATDFISPRMVDTSAGTTSRYVMRDLYWVRKN